MKSSQSDRFLSCLRVSSDPDSVCALADAVRRVFVPSLADESAAPEEETVFLLVKLHQPICLTIEECNDANAVETIPQFLCFVEELIQVLGEPLDCLIGKVPNGCLEAILNGSFPGTDAGEIANAQAQCNCACSQSVNKSTV